MKKILTSFFVLTLSFGVFAQQFNLGKVSFATDSVWIISGNGITQIWSDAVQTDSCSNKTSFAPGSCHWGYFADCRSNPDYKGDLFSWVAVRDFKNELCPYPWRVPTKQDFIDLDIAMGGTGNQRTDLEFVNSKYFGKWGGVLGGIAFYVELFNQNIGAFYWSQSSDDSLRGGFSLWFGADGHINTQSDDMASQGSSLRCVRDN